MVEKNEYSLINLVYLVGSLDDDRGTVLYYISFHARPLSKRSMHDVPLWNTNFLDGSFV